jgi:hypothetical protein
LPRPNVKMGKVRKKLASREIGKSAGWEEKRTANSD